MEADKSQENLLFAATRTDSEPQACQAGSGSPSPRHVFRRQHYQVMRVMGLLFFFFSTFIYFWDRERQNMNGGGAEREGDTESEAGSRL